MRSVSLTSLSLVAVIVALAAWAGVWFLFSDVSSRLDASAQLLSSAATQNAKQESDAEVTALASDTAAQRAALDAEVDTDVVGIANVIQSAGEAAGATTVIGSASQAGEDTTSGVSTLDFVVQASGSFAQVWRAAELFETLPLPSSVTELDFEQFPGSGGKGDSWQLTADIEVLTSSQISS